MAAHERVPRSELLARGAAAFDRQAWAEALKTLIEADHEQPLDLDGLEMLAMAAHLNGRDDIATAIGMRGFQAGAASGAIERAARCGFWTAMAFMFRGDMTQAGAWFGRSRELIESSGVDTVQSGYLLVPQALGQLRGGDAPGAFATFEKIAALAARFGDPDLATLGRLGRGQALIAKGERERGIGFLDEAMASVMSGEASAVVAGIVYCATIEACHRVLDMRRAQEWTAALTAWCAAQPDLVPYRGQCLVYRAELLRLHGDWSSAADEALRAQRMLIGPPPDPAAGEALYQIAEVHRLRGDDALAEAAYVEASRFGRPGEPGLALLRLAQGRSGAARSIIERAIAERPDDPRLREAAVTIALARHDVTDARRQLGPLHAAAEHAGVPLLQAMAARAEGETLLAEGSAGQALRALRAAWTLWQELDAPYEGARARISIAAACRALGDDETAELEAAAARELFVRLGAAPALAELDARTAPGGPDRHGLSTREREVLRLVAAGRTNRDIAEALGISERTVDRHVSNLFTKLDVSSRAAATAWAYQHDLA